MLNVQAVMAMGDAPLIGAIHVVIQRYSQKIEAGKVPGNPTVLSILSEMESCLRFCLYDGSPHSFVGTAIRKACTRVRDPRVWIEVMHVFLKENFLTVPKNVRIH